MSGFCPSIIWKREGLFSQLNVCFVRARPITGRQGPIMPNPNRTLITPFLLHVETPPPFGTPCERRSSSDYSTRSGSRFGSHNSGLDSLRLAPKPVSATRAFPTVAVIIGIHQFILLALRTPHDIAFIAHLLADFRAEVDEIVRIIHLSKLSQPAVDKVIRTAPMHNWQLPGPLMICSSCFHSCTSSNRSSGGSP